MLQVFIQQIRTYNNLTCQSETLKARYRLKLSSKQCWQAPFKSSTQTWGPAPWLGSGQGSNLFFPSSKNLAQVHHSGEKAGYSTWESCCLRQKVRSHTHSVRRGIQVSFQLFIFYVFTSNRYGLSSSVPSGASCVVGPDLHVYLSFCLQNIESGFWSAARSALIKMLDPDYCQSSSVPSGVSCVADPDLHVYLC